LNSIFISAAAGTAEITSHHMFFFLRQRKLEVCDSGITGNDFFQSVNADERVN